jgi:micrococcal nuclease
VPTQEAVPGEEPTRSTQVLLASQGRVLAHVHRVIDGDVIEVELAGHLKRVRYIGINAAEVGFPYADQSTEANRRLVEGQDVLLEKDRSEADRYNRLLRYVYLTNCIFVNAELASDGMAEAIAYFPDTKYQMMLDMLEKKAQEQGLGM